MRFHEPVRIDLKPDKEYLRKEVAAALEDYENADPPMDRNEFAKQLVELILR